MRIFQILVLLSSFLFVAKPVFATASYPNNFDKKYWEKILHYNKDESRADGEKFFIAPDGKTNPIAELYATIEAFKNPDYKSGWFNYHPQCVFVERYHFLKESGLLENVEKIDCPEFNDWVNGINAESVTLIYSSSYPNNPSSLFGHTLLRLNQKNKQNDLLDYAVAFSAIPDVDDPGILFALKGIFGGYKGLFEITKYYTKVNEYNNGESRDLIEYNLKMNQDELDRMLRHLWELYQTTFFYYYFTDENCSAVLAELLAVAYKDIEGVSAQKRWFYLPAEMIKHFHNELKLVDSVVYRPSLKKEMLASFNDLSLKEVSEIRESVKVKELKSTANPHVLEGIGKVLEFSQYRKKHPLEKEDATLQRKALIARSKLPKKEIKKYSYDQSNRPENGHDPSRFEIGFGIENSREIVTIESRQGYHDLMSDDRGFDRFSNFEILLIKGLYDLENKKLKLDKLTFANLASLHDYRFYDPQLAWKANVGIERIFDLDCLYCYKIRAQAMGGVSHRPTTNQVVSFLVGLNLEVGDDFTKGYRVGPSAEASYYLQFGNSYKIGLFNEINFDLKNKIADDFYNHLGIRQSIFLKENHDLRLEAYFTSKFGSFKKETSNIKALYGIYY